MGVSVIIATHWVTVLSCPTEDSLQSDFPNRHQLCSVSFGYQALAGSPNHSHFILGMVEMGCRYLSLPKPPSLQADKCYLFLVCVFLQNSLLIAITLLCWDQLLHELFSSFHLWSHYFRNCWLSFFLPPPLSCLFLWSSVWFHLCPKWLQSPDTVFPLLPPWLSGVMFWGCIRWCAEYLQLLMARQTLGIISTLKSTSTVLGLKELNDLAKRMGTF